MARTTVASGLVPALLVMGACLSVQDFGDDGGPHPIDGAVQPDAPSFGDASGGPIGTYRWAWVNPTPTGRTLYAIAGAAETDIWVAGEGGSVAHWNGTTWDVRHTGDEGARYFSLGVRASDDVWVAGDANGRIDVMHYDGTGWRESYPFSGSAFGSFSHGPGARLFAVVDWDIQELSATGTWVSTDTRENTVFGPPADVWVAASGDAWAITTGAKILHLPAGSTTWELVGSIAGVPSNTVGLAISGSGTKVCAFYTGRTASSGIGYLTYDGAWQVGPTSSAPLPVDTSPRGARSACFADGSGLLVHEGDLVLASPTAAPTVHVPTDFEDERLFGAWSNGGDRAYAVGSLGAFVTRMPGALRGAEVGPTLRGDVLAIDVGVDGAVLAVNAAQPDRSAGGDVLHYASGVLKALPPGGFAAPSIPVGVAVLDEDDAWVLTNDGFAVGVARWRNGAWGATRILSPSDEPLAIFAPAKDDVWVTAKKHAWHYDGVAWIEVAVGAAYRSIHGSAPNDVWFAGDDVAHWNGDALTPVAQAGGSFTGVWASSPARVWLWGDRAVLFDGESTVPVEEALGASAEWTTTGIAESLAGDVFVLTKQGTGTALLWFDSSRTKLLEQVSSDLELTGIRGRGNELWAFGVGGASLRFAPPVVR